jgi:type IV secretion system protein VirD4
MDENTMILGEDRYYSMDAYKTGVNNNVLVVGASGAGKTRGIVIPNLLQATGSYVITDPKGNLYNKYGGYLRKHGYNVGKLDFTNPSHSLRYNFFNYIHSTQDVLKISHMLMDEDKKGRSVDPFWDQAAQLLIQSLIALVDERYPDSEKNFSSLMRLLESASACGDFDSQSMPLDSYFSSWESVHPDSYAVRTYKKFRVASSRTLRSILVTANSRLGVYDTPELEKMMKEDDVNISWIGRRKTALFVVVSDTDRSMDRLVNLFFSQAMNELCRYADTKCTDYRLPVPVRFIMDDFATNCKIEEFPRMIASIRSREISTTLIIQAESQLTQCYGYDGRTIIGNCDTYVYLGGNDVETAKAVAERCDMPVKKILNMPVGTNWIFRRGEEPRNGVNFKLDEVLHELEAVI